MHKEDNFNQWALIIYGHKSKVKKRPMNFQVINL